MMKYLLLYCLLFFIFSPVWADNLRIREEVKVLSVTSEAVELEISVSWSNSWHNEYNYDAVYIFGKYRTDDVLNWNHLYFDELENAHVVSAGYRLKPVNGGRGIFLYRASKGQGQASATLHLKWKIAANAANPLTQEHFDTHKVRFSIQGLEMVYVPTAPFYVGDGISKNSFSSPFFGTLPAEYDLIGTNSTFAYAANGSETSATYVNRVADRYNQGEYIASNRRDWCGTAMPAWWRVDFKTEKTIRYFGVSGVFGQEYSPSPAGTWFLQGSQNASQWDTLWSGGPEYWGQSKISYPVQRAIRVTKPGSYRYYRILVEDNQCSAIWNNIRISNVAMTETDLSTLTTGAPFLCTASQNLLPAGYPSGVAGFYAMKYELTQEQYVVFLNQQNRSAQYMRTLGGLLDGLKEGDYVFGDDREQATARNGIVLHECRLDGGEPYVFACNLDRSDLPNNPADGQTLACNFLSPADMLAYADWSGLRPLSELEYEKMCRGYYPVLPKGGEFAWESVSYRATTGVSAGGTEDESPDGTEANVNAGGSVQGGVRVGLFVRPGSRIQSGNSFWGFSDLSGNLSEIYCNADMYGLQLDGQIHGTGGLQENGEVSVSPGSWPRNVEAYGVRGGSYASPSEELAVSDRSHAKEYFSSLTDRKPTVGIRLGYTSGYRRVDSELTLENGKTSGNSVVYDTVCDASDYTIQGTTLEAGEEVCQYVWYRSTDEGNTWKQLPNVTGRDLEVTGLLPDGKDITIKKHLYKRMAYAPGLISESGVVGVVLASGYTISRLVDTLQPCMASPGFEVKTPIPADFEWYYLDNGKRLEAQRESETESFYMPSTKDIKINGKLDGGEYHFEVAVKMQKGCSWRQKLKVFVLPWTEAPWDGNEVIKVTDSDADSRQLVADWGGRDEQKWSITSLQPGALTIDSLTGTLHGMAQTMCNITINLVCADFPDRVYTKAVKETFRDWYFLEPGTPRTLTLLPGKYKMECMGSQGGSFSGSAPGGLGGDVWGYIELEQVQKFYIYVGRTPYSATEGGYNGGGGSSNASLSVAAGGATDIRLTGGAWNDPVSLASRIMVAGGGGSSGHTGKGGAGGGLVGGNGSNYTQAGGWGVGGTQTAAGYSAGVAAGLGQGGKGYEHGGGGGGGYYGGGGGRCSSGVCCAYAGGGGSGYVSGYPGCVIHSSGLKFENPGMTSGVRTGNGYVRIEQL